MLKCEVHENCDKPVVAKIGLPSIHAKWACEDGFNEFRKREGEDLTNPPRDDKKRA